MGKSKEVGMVRMAKSGTNEGVVKWVDNTANERVRKCSINKGGGGHGDKSGSSNVAERNCEAPIKA